MLAVFAFLKPLNAQFLQCIDTIRKNPTAQCNDPAFNPVCGCDYVTYRNVCDAYQRAGVNYWTSGVCAGFFVDIFPNPVRDLNYLQMNAQFRDNESGNLTVLLTDSYGRVVYQRYQNYTNKLTLYIDFTPFRAGLYVLVVWDSNKQVVIKKVLKAG